ncbi:MAG TPA: glutaredoxin family protein [Burkholderiales bacterium]|nr:glutaredoxin family protein [Burkholderiales bacterium]
MSALRFLLLVGLIAPLSASPGVYKWTDAQGRVHYSDDPPPEAKAQQIKLKINSIQGPAVVSSMRDAPPAKAKDKVRIYSAPWCGYCKKAKAHLAARRVPYDDVDVEASERGRSEFLQLRGRGVPVILVGNQRMDGFDARRLDAMLSAAGW